ncbi:hypothetical protein CQW23_01133 [Capsicum baccatum]|uniref:F-box domain-containing protein n=1 Tax=Capsicum baccatum TaxID=33114 RepID=A0A2G2XMR9_CAPBA|nr:hypothetical protein CQW23_01133 [Capsicum baccatum]
MRSEGRPAADRISNLPCNVTEQILGSLPLRDTLRTSILSRDWRYKWVEDLRHLELCCCKLHPPPNFKAFSRLVAFIFRYVTLEPTSFQTLLSSCPLIERVTLDWCAPFDNVHAPFDNLNVDAPSLKFFEFTGTTKSICFGNTPLVEEIITSITSNFHKSFKVGLPVSQVTLHNIKILNFRNFNSSCVKGAAFMLDLINCCPNIERLTIANLVEPIVRLLRAQGMPHTSLKQLKRVDMKFLLAHEPEIELLKYVLSVAASLEKLCVQTYMSYVMKNVYDVERMEEFVGMKMMVRMTQFPRAMPNVEFVYEEVYHAEPNEFWVELGDIQLLYPWLLG